jgi:alginate O-acetyltransferase complex protein AlgJ
MKSPNNGASAADALIDLSNQLRRRGIHFTVVPVPAKASIYPELLDPRYNVALGPKLNVQHTEWFASLRSGQVDTLDLTDLLWHAKADGLVFYPTDTHWNNRAIRLAAAEIAAHLRGQVDLPPARKYESRWVEYTRDADLIRLANQPSTPRNKVHDRYLQIYNSAGPLQPGDDAPVLILGDSFAELYNTEGCSIAQQLSNALGVDVQSGAKAAGLPSDIWNTLQTNPHMLDKKKAVVLVFTIRHVARSEWQSVEVTRP